MDWYILRNVSVNVNGWQHVSFRIQRRLSVFELCSVTIRLIKNIDSNKVGPITVERRGELRREAIDFAKICFPCLF